MPPNEQKSLTHQQRAEIFAYRRAHGYPDHAPPHPYREAGVYLLTAATDGRAPVLTAGHRTGFEQQLIYLFNTVKIHPIAWVILPDHYHVLADVSSLDILSAAIKKLHGAPAYEWNQADGLQGRRKVWYHFSDRMIRNEIHFYTTVNYIHANPMKHGYVTEPYEWVWSSLSLYLQDYGRDWLRETWQKYPPGGFGKEWDE